MNKKKIIIVACEGQHDISFIVRILCSVGFQINNKKIIEFSKPFDQLFGGIAKKMILDDKKLGYQSPNYLLPSVALYFGDEKEVFLHNLNGDSSCKERKDLISSYSNLNGEDDFSKNLNYEFRFLFFFDADNIGVNERLSKIAIELEIGKTSMLNEEIEKTSMLNGEIIKKDGYELGCYIYHENNKEEGVLEDILLEHFTTKAPELSQSISLFLTTNALLPERAKELCVVNGQEGRKGKSKYSVKKSKINLFGQLQFSGMSNSVIISKSDFLDKNSINNCKQCSIIKKMF